MIVDPPGGRPPAHELVLLGFDVNEDGADDLYLHAESFRLFRSGTRLVPDEETDIVTLGPSERAILEFTLPVRGRYMFQPHQHHLAERGATGWFAAV